jgi:hypothetical protein
VGGYRAKHFYAADELGSIASDVLKSVRIQRSDRATPEDCWQVMYLAGLMARRSAASQRTISRKVLEQAMREAALRLIGRRREVREADLV